MYIYGPNFIHTYILFSTITSLPLLLRLPNTKPFRYPQSQSFHTCVSITILLYSKDPCNCPAQPHTIGNHRAGNLKFSDDEVLKPLCAVVAAVTLCMGRFSGCLFLASDVGVGGERIIGARELERAKRDMVLFFLWACSYCVVLG